MNPVPAAFSAALAELDDTVLTGRDKGIPSGARVRLGDLGTQGWNVLAGDLPLPSLTLSLADLEHNIATVQRYCDDHGAWLSPHGKTSMSPQLYARQLEAGAWAISVANISQLQVCRSFGIPRLFVANEMVADYDIAFVAAQMRADPEVEIYLLVDAVEGVERLQRQLAANPPVGRPLPVLVELGMSGGRCGTRSVAELEAVAHAVVRAAPLIRLAGVEGYEGCVAPPDRLAGPLHLAAIDRYLDDLAEGVRRLRPLAPDADVFLASSGGSMFPDRVVAKLGADAIPDAQLVLRSGGYTSHDDRFLDENSVFGRQSERRGSLPALRPAFQVWASVLAHPEDGLYILGMGRRDIPMDQGPPIVRERARIRERPEPLAGCAVTDANDQHGYLRAPPDADLTIGDLVGCGINHPCAAFDRWRTVLLVDDDWTVVGGLNTFF